MTVQLSPETIRALQKLWVALPVKAPNDGVSDPGERQRAILETYCEALSDCSPEAIGQTVRLLIAGKIDEASKSFCPKPPELATFVRAEQRKINAAKRERQLPPPQRDENEHSSEHRMKMLGLLKTLNRALNGDREAQAFLDERMAQRGVKHYGWRR